MKLRNTLLAATIMALPVAAMAQPVTGLYVGGGMGYNYLDNVNATLRAPAAAGLPNNGTGSGLSGNGGFVGILDGGWGFGNGFRAEVSGEYRNNPMHGPRAGGVGGVTFQTFGVMVNGLYDFNVGATWIYPYAGIGVGYQWTNFTNVTTGFAGYTTSGGQTKGGFAVNGILGAAFPITPALSITAEYRFMGVVTNPTFGTTLTQASTGKSVSTSVRVGNQYNNAAIVGVRYAFGAVPPPPPAAAPAPAPAPARTYLVFFDWDKYNLSDRAKAIIADAAAASTKTQTTRIEVDGHTDTTGTAAYNLGLSRRRADAVAAELIKDGVPKAAITIQAFGDTHLLVPTGPQVREPQNRRVEIILK